MTVDPGLRLVDQIFKQSQNREPQTGPSKFHMSSAPSIFGNAYQVLASFYRRVMQSFSLRKPSSKIDSFATILTILDD
jgi:hypothetical protein